MDNKLAFIALRGELILPNDFDIGDAVSRRSCATGYITNTE